METIPHSNHRTGISLPTVHQQPVATTLEEIQGELRNRRKRFLGSDLSLNSIVIAANGIVDPERAAELSQYLTSKTIPLWKCYAQGKESFCMQFYTLAIYSIAGGRVGHESIDDIIQLANCLVRSQDTFVKVLKQLLPPDRIGEMFNFVESHDEALYSPTFADAVLGAVAVYLGVLADPTPDSMGAPQTEG